VTRLRCWEISDHLGSDVRSREKSVKKQIVIAAVFAVSSARYIAAASE
jgi:hypothetical protein